MNEAIESNANADTAGRHERVVIRHGWAKDYIQKLLTGEAVEFRPRGNSMSGRVESGQLCTVEPLIRPPKKKDVVLCQVGTKQYLHLVTAVKGGRFQIGNNHGKVNGWVGIDNIYGVLVRAV